MSLTVAPIVATI